jgi:hypothetical protein
MIKRIFIFKRIKYLKIKILFKTFQQIVQYFLKELLFSKCWKLTLNKKNFTMLSESNV